MLGASGVRGAAQADASPSAFEDRRDQNPVDGAGAFPWGSTLVLCCEFVFLRSTNMVEAVVIVSFANVGVARALETLQDSMRI